MGQLNNIIWVYPAEQHYLGVPSWTTLSGCTQLNNIISVYPAEQHHLGLPGWTTLFGCTQPNNILPEHFTILFVSLFVHHQMFNNCTFKSSASPCIFEPLFQIHDTKINLIIFSVILALKFHKLWIIWNI